jgi:hypothetical protein
VPVDHRATFRLERFEWRPPDRIEITGSWTDLGDVVLPAPVLVLCTGDKELRLQALPEGAGMRPDRGRWRAAFAWPQDPGDIPNATLFLGKDFALDLPSLVRNRTRFGRPVIKARPREPAADAQVDDPDAFDHHTALVLAREDAEAAREEAKEAREAARIAQEGLARERTRGQAETARMREALVAAEQMAKRSVKQMTAVNDLLKVELKDVTAALDTERARAAGWQRREQELVDRLDDAQRQLQELAGLRRDLEAAHQAARSEYSRSSTLAARLTAIRRAMDADDPYELLDGPGATEHVSAPDGPATSSRPAAATPPTRPAAAPDRRP